MMCNVKGQSIACPGKGRGITKRRRHGIFRAGGVGWVGGIRTHGCGSQSPVPYRLATTHYRKKRTLSNSLSVHVGWLVGLEPTASRATIWRASQLRHSHHIIGAPGGTRTPGPLLRRQLLYPPELRAPESSGLCETLLEYHTMRNGKSQAFEKSFSGFPLALPRGICYTDTKPSAALPCPPGMACRAARKGRFIECRISGMI